MKACYDITGMNCAACSAAVERAVRNAGIEDASVNLLSGVLTVDYDENIISEKDIFTAVKKAGFGIEKAKSASGEEGMFLDSTVIAGPDEKLWKTIL
jgi:copper chaperone CopZ